MKVELIYVYGGSDASQLAQRFVQTYFDRPPGCDHSFTVVLNQPLEASDNELFGKVADRMVEHDNSGWDIGAYQAAARTSSADLCLFLGSHTHFQFPYWLRRMATVAEAFGPGNLYGAFATSLIRPHIRTSAFWCNPKLFLDIYPEAVKGRTSGGDRYEFEHGQRSLTTRWMLSDRQALLVTWDRVHKPEEWLDLRELQWWPPSQKNLLLRDRHVDTYRDYGRCDAQNPALLRCELAVNHPGKHYAAARFFQI